MAKLVSKTYSEALFEVALEEEKVELFLKELEFIVDSLKTYPEFFVLLKSPRINVDEKKKMIAEVFSDKLSEEMNNFLKIILDKRRSGYMEQIKDEYEKLVNEHMGIVKTVATTAVPLSEAEQNNLVEKLEKVTGKKIKLTNSVDKDLLGGVLVKIGDKVIDGTVKSRLNDLREDLAKIIV